MIEMVLLTACSSLALCSVCLTVAKRNTPLSKNDAEMIWAMHKQNNPCSARKWNPIRQGRTEIVGFRCECGYEYTQKRPLLSRMPQTQ